MAVISNIIEEIRSRNLFPRIQRMQFEYSLERARSVVLEIGKSRNPNFTIDTENVFAYENFIKWLMGDPSMLCLDPKTKQPATGRLEAGIYVAGNTGTGKSWLLEIMSALCIIDEPRITIGEVTRPLRWSNYRADFICDEFTSKGDISRFKNMSVLGIQDLGSEPRESLYMGNRVSVIGSVIESRGDREDLLTLISSNIPINHERLEETYGSRVVSRLAQMCNYFEIRGKDRRKAL